MKCANETVTIELKNGKHTCAVPQGREDRKKKRKKTKESKKIILTFTPAQAPSCTEP